MKKIKQRILASILAFTIAFTSSGITEFVHASELQTINNSSLEIQEVSNDKNTTEQQETKNKEVKTENTKQILSFEKNEFEITVTNEDEITEKLPKTILANVENDETVELEITWEQKVKINEEAVLIEYEAKLTNDEYKLSENVKMPILKCYIGNFEVDKDSVCQECFENKTIDDICLSCYQHETKCNCEELDLENGNIEQRVAFTNKYLPNGYLQLLEYDNNWINGLKPNAKKYVIDLKEFAEITLLRDFYSNSSIADIVKYIDEGRLSYWDEYTPNCAEGKFTYEQLEELAPYGFKLVDIANFYYAVNETGCPSSLYTAYKQDPENASDGLKKLYDIVLDIIKIELMMNSVTGFQTFAGTQTGGNGIDPNAPKVTATKGQFVDHFNTYIKSINGNASFCASKNKPYNGGEYVLVEVIKNCPFGGHIAHINNSGVQLELPVYIPYQLGIWTRLGQIDEATALSILKKCWQTPDLYSNALNSYKAVITGDSYADVYVYMPANGADEQPLWTTYSAGNIGGTGGTGTTPPGTGGAPTGTIEFGTAYAESTTTYKSNIHKTSIITNEALSGIVFNVQEKLIDDKGSAQACDGNDCKWTVTTDGNGNASISSSHSGSWSADYITTTGTLSTALQQIYDDYLAEGGHTQSSAEAYVQNEKEKFESVTYEYIWTEQDNYTRSESLMDQNNKRLTSISLPKFGYRKNITQIDNTNAYSAVTKNDLTTNSVLSSGTVRNGGNGSVNMTNQPWRNQIFINKTDLETNNQIKYDTKFDIYEWTGSTWGQDNYEVIRITEDIANTMGWGKEAVGMYTVHRKQSADAYTGTTFTSYKTYGSLYFTQVNQGKFKIVETQAPANNELTGYIGNFAERPYTKLNNLTNKEVPPITINNDIATTKIEHFINLCKDTSQYGNYMLIDGHVDYDGSFYTFTEGYDNTSKIYTGSTSGTSNGVDKLYYTGSHTYTKINYNTYNKNASVLNLRHGFNNSHIIEIEKPEITKDYAFINERVYGFIRLTKFDIEAERYVNGNLDLNYTDGTHHGDADLNGAIYSIYVDDSSASYNATQIANGGIKHPDGVVTEDDYHNADGIAIMREQQVFVDTNNDGFADTWTVHNATLTPGTKVASATIKNGELQFDGLYLGNYYIVEEVRAVETVTSTNSDNEVHNEIRKLSFAPGYLAETDEHNDVIKHYYEIKYQNETNYVIKDTDEITNQQVIKGGIQIIKMTTNETTGSGYTALDALAGAGFTIFQISELSRIKDGSIVPDFTLEEGHDMVSDGRMVKLYDSVGQFVGYKLVDATGLPNENANRITYVPGYGYYFQSTILGGYINPQYSNFEQKWDFTNETQAIARVYENDTAYVTKTNGTLIHIPNTLGPNGTDSEFYGQNGISDGMVAGPVSALKYPYSTNTNSDRTVLQTTKEYTISEIFTNTWGEIKTPLLAWGDYIIVETTVPKDKFTVDPFFISISDTSPTIDRTKSYYEINESMTQQLILVKRDAQTGQDVLQSNIKFRIWSYNDNRYISIMSQGTSSVAQRINTFETGADGRVLFSGLSNLEVGKYRIEEITGPKGYWNEYWDYGNPNTNPEFSNETLGGAGTDADVPNDENMKNPYLGSVDFEITSDRLFQSSGLITDNNLDMLYIGEYYKNQETLGMITISKTGEVLVGYENTDDIEYADEYTTVNDPEFNPNKTYKKRSEFETNVEKFDIGTDRVSEGTSPGAAYTDKKVEANYEYDDNTYDFVYEERPLADATYQIIAAEDIYTPDNQKNSDGSRTTWFKKGDIVATVTTAQDGEIVDFIPNYNVGGNYDYELTKTGHKGTKQYTSEEFATTGVIENKWIENKMSILDKAIYGIPDFSDEYIYPNSYIDENGERQVVVRVIKTGQLGEVSLLVPLGKYTVKEIKAPHGYVLSNQEFTIDLKWKDQIKEVVFNTNQETITATKNQIDSFVDRSLDWWIGGTNTTGDILETRIGTFTNRYMGEAEDVYYTDEQGFVNFFNERIKAIPQELPNSNKYLSLGVYKEDAETGEKIKNAKYGLWTKHDIYNVDGKLLVEADTLLAVATTDESGLAIFDVDVPYGSKHFGTTTRDNELLYSKNTSDTNVSMDGNTSANSGEYYIKELTPPEGYLLNDEIYELKFEYKDQDTLLLPVYTVDRNIKTEVDLSKRDITNQEEIIGAKLAVYEVTNIVYKETGEIDYEKSTLSAAIDQWTSDGTPHVIRGLQLSNLEFPRLNNDAKREHVYLLRELTPANGYVTATDVVFELVQDFTVDNNGNKDFLSTNTIWVNKETTTPYITGVFKAQQNYTDHEGADEYNFNHDYYEYRNDAGHVVELIPDGCTVKDQKADIVANWTYINNILIIDVEDVSEDSIKKSVNGKRLTLALEMAGIDTSEIENIYFLTEEVNGIFESETTEQNPENDPGFSLGGTPFISPFNETMIIDELPADIKVLLNEELLASTNPTVEVIKTFDWMAVNTAYNNEQNFATIENGSEHLDQKPEIALQNTVIMEDERTKLWISKADITTSKEVIGSKVQILNKNGVVVDEWITDGMDRYIELLPIGDYILHEEQAPIENGYVHTEDIKFTIEDNGYINKVYMPDNYTRLKITKTDIVNNEPIIGAQLILFDKDGRVIKTWETTDEPNYITYLPVGQYKLQEILPPTKDGYVQSNEITFELKNEDVVTKVDMKDDFTVTKISKVDIVTGEEIAGAHLTIYPYEKVTTTITHPEEQGPNGIIPEWTEIIESEELSDTPIAEWISGVDGTNSDGTIKPHYIEYLPVGKYQLVETQAPDGYLVANSIDFEVVDKLYHYDDDKETILRDDDGNIIFNENEVIKVEMKDDFTKLNVSKVDMTNKKEIAGAKLQIWTTETINNELTKVELYEEWISGSDGTNLDGTIKPHYIERIPVGKYILIETQAPDGYIVAEDIEFEVLDTGEIQNVIMEDERGLLISKQNLINGTEVEGAKLSIYSMKEVEGEYVTDQVIETWTTAKTPYGINVDKLTLNNYYLLREEKAPAGYFLANDIIFKLVLETNEEIPTVYIRNEKTNKFEKTENRTIIMKDDSTTVNIFKRDAGNRKILANAKLHIEDTKGNIVIKQFTTGTSYTQILGLPQGTYYLVEDEAPKGYNKTGKVKFEIKDEHNTSNPLEVNMFDTVIKPAVNPVPDSDPEPDTTPTTPTPTPQKPSEVITHQPVPTGDTNNGLIYLFGIFGLVTILGFAIKKRKDNK